MHADHFFSIGSNHQSQGSPCEDYALSGVTASGRVFAVVADGCSGASEPDANGNSVHANTDIGARAITWAFKKSLDMFSDAESAQFNHHFYQALLGNFSRYRYDDGIADYLATVVGIVASPTDAAIFIQGDGAVALKYFDGSIKLIELSWWNNMPYYLAYQLNMTQNDMFERTYQDGIIEPFCKKTTFWNKDYLGVQTTIERFSMGDAAKGCTLRFNPLVENIQAIAVLTDGIEQVGELPTNQVVQELLSFKKSVKGSFVKRRMMRALQSFAKQGAIPKDDISMAAVWFDEGSVNELS